MDFARTIGNYLFLQLSAASWVIRYLTTCKGLVKKRFMGAFLCLKERPPTTKKSFLSIYHLEHINSRSVLIVAAGNSIMCWILYICENLPMPCRFRKQLFYYCNIFYKRRGYYYSILYDFWLEACKVKLHLILLVQLMWASFLWRFFCKYKVCVVWYVWRFGEKNNKRKISSPPLKWWL